MQVNGTIKVIKPTQEVSASFKKRELVVTTEEQYPQQILIEFNQDKCDILDKYAVGDSVSVGVNLRGREWVNPQGETKYFNTIQGWKIEKLGNEETKPTNDIPVHQAQVISPTPAAQNEALDDLPF